jgi:regulator of PEP synthase PpsR (kinase-PPPase family)
MIGRAVEIHIVSDSTGDTASRVARAAQAQFSESPVQVIRHPRVTTVEGLARAFAKIRSGDGGAAVFYTLIDRELREQARSLSQRHGIPSCDLLGPPLEALQAASGSEAELVPGRPVALEPDYFKRVAAMEFAVKHDDGLSGEGLGYKTANTPLVAGVEPPAALFRIDRRKVVGLTIDAERLQRIRGRRLRAIGGRGRNDYADLARILEELEMAAQIQRRLGCPVIDVSNLAVEESALRVINLVEERSRDEGGGVE